MNLTLPRTSLARVVAYGLCAWALWIGAGLATQGRLTPSLVAAFWFVFAVAIALRLEIARRTAQVVLWILVVLTPLAVLNPFNAIDASASDPPLWSLVLRDIVVPEACALAALHVLTTQAHAFRRLRVRRSA